MFDLGLPSDVVWGLTLRQFDALKQRWRATERAADRRTGEILAMLYNINRDRKTDPRGATWLAFFPEPEKIQSDDEMFSAMMVWSKARPA